MPISWATFTVTTFTEWVRAFRRVMGRRMCRRNSWASISYPPFKNDGRIHDDGGRVYAWSRAETKTIGLNAEPVCLRACVARLNWLLRKSLLHHRFRYLSPNQNRAMLLQEKEGAGRKCIFAFFRSLWVQLQPPPRRHPASGDPGWCKPGAHSYREPLSRIVLQHTFSHAL